MDERTLERIAADPRFRALVRRRSRLAAMLSVGVVAAFVVFLLIVALNKTVLAIPIDGMTATWGIPVGIGLILLAIASIAVFTRRSNQIYDPEMTRILKDYGL